MNSIFVEQTRWGPLRFLLACACLSTVLFLADTQAYASVTSITPNTWNVIGLDSNSPATGPSSFPVGAKVCGNVPGEIVPVTLTWDRTNPYVSWRSGSAGAPDGPPGGLKVTLGTTAGPDGYCADAFFEIDISRTSNAFTSDTNLPARYHITAGGLSTPTPRELIVERLVSQGRNAITNMEFGTTEASLQSVPPGGSMNLIKGNTYFIKMTGYTATQGYEQLESFISFSNVLFQILSVKTIYSADTSSLVNSPNDNLYGDACGWDNDPASLNYRGCNQTGKVGGNINVTYQVKIIEVGSGVQQLNTLIHDFSGSSFHYNSDYSTGARLAYLIDPANATMSKSFFPNPTNVATGSTLTFTIANPNAGAISGLNFSDNFATVVVTPSGGTLRVAATPGISNTCGGTVTDLGGVNPPSSGSTGIMLTGGTIAGNSSCTIRVNVTASAGSTAGTTYLNTAERLTVTLSDGTTVNTASPLATATLTVTTAAPPAPPVTSCSNPVELARWTFDGTDFNNTALPSAGTTINSGIYLNASTKRPDVSYARAWADYGSASNGGIANATTTPWGGCTNGCNPGKPYPASADTTNSWGYVGGWPASNPTPTTQPAFEFELDTSNYGGVGFATDYNLEDNWSNGNSWYLWGSTDGSSWTQLNTTTNTWNSANKNAWTAGGIFNNTTLPYAKYFRVTVAGAQYSGGASSSTGATLYLDNVKIIGCPRYKTPTILKHFAPNPILANGVSMLQFTISNPNQDADLTAVSFTDDFSSAVVNPAGGALKVASTPAVTNSCGGTVSDLGGASPLPANSSGIKLTGATVPKGGACTVTVAVTATAEGTYLNTATVFDTNAGASYTNTSSDTLTVNAPSPAISIFKEVATAAATPPPDSPLWRSDVAVKQGDNVYYQFTLQNDGDVQLTEVQATDPVFPNLYNCNGNGWKYGDGTTTVPLTGNKFTLEAYSSSDLVYKDFATCIIGPVTAVSGTNVNTATVNAKYAGASLPYEAGITDETATYYGFAPPTVSKAFSPDSIPTGGTSTMTITVTNPVGNPGNLTGVSISDSYPGTLKNKAAGTLACTGAGSATLTGGTVDGTSVGFTGGIVVPGGTCSITQSVTATATENNITGAPATAGIVIPSKGAAPMALTGTAAGPVTLTVTPAPNLMVLKTAFGVLSGATAKPGQEVPYLITVTNDGAGKAWEVNVHDALSPYAAFKLNSLAFTDGAVSSGLSMVNSTTSYSYDNGTTWTTAPPADLGGGYNGTVTNWKIDFDPAIPMNANNAFFTISFKVLVK